MNLVKKYIGEGYIVSPYSCKGDYDESSIIKTTIGEKELKQLVRHFTTKDSDILNKEMVLFKIDKPYHITPKDLLVRLEEEMNSFNQYSYSYLIDWLNFIDVCSKSEHIYYPYLKDDYFKDYDKDYLFKNKDHIVSYIIFLLRVDMNENNVLMKLHNYVSFIKDLIDDKNEYYSQSTLYLMLNEIGYKSYRHVEISDECLDFYQTKLMENAELGDNSSMELLGYEYYEGNNGFPNDFIKAEYWLNKYFNKTQDTDVARTLGYIYYYGRCTNGVPEKEKAFQYFAMSHFATNNEEATYKLADCYLKGYGTPICEEAAFKLVYSLFHKAKDDYLNDMVNKYADVALRLAKYFRDGIYMEADKELALSLFIDARTAIKDRLETMDYIGDRGLAISIMHSIIDLKKELKIAPREVIDNGYVIDDIEWNHHNCKFDLSKKDNDILLTIYPMKKYKNVSNVLTSIGFAEKVKTATFLIKCKRNNESFMKTISKGKLLSFDFRDKEFVVFLKVKGEVTRASIHYDKLLVLPKNNKNVSKLYNIVSVAPYGNDRKYDYLCDNENIEKGDYVYIMVRGELKEVQVLESYTLYEDEIALPFEKMSKTYTILN